MKHIKDRLIAGLVIALLSLPFLLFSEKCNGQNQKNLLREFQWDWPVTTINSVEMEVKDNKGISIFKGYKDAKIVIKSGVNNSITNVTLKLYLSGYFEEEGTVTRTVYDYSEEGKTLSYTMIKENKIVAVSFILDYDDSITGVVVVFTKDYKAKSMKSLTMVLNGITVKGSGS